MMETILRFVACLRRLFEPLTWRWFQPKDWEKLPDLDKWEDVRDLSPSAFSRLINGFKYTYNWDKLRGLLDNSQPLDKPQFFFKDLTTDRDCDNWARIWSSYYTYHNIPVQEWIVTNTKHPFTQSHFVAVANEGDGWRLLNYVRYDKTHTSPECAIADIKTWNSGNYADDIRLQCLYKDYSEPNSEEDRA